MNQGTIKYSKVGSDEVELELPFTQTIFNLVRVRIKAANNKSFADDNYSLGTYAALYYAEMCGHKLVDLPDIKKLTPEDVLLANLKYDCIVEQPEGESKVSEDEADENPTDTKGE